MPKIAISTMHGCHHFVFMRTGDIILVTSQPGFFGLPQLSSPAGNVDTVIINRSFSANFQKQTLYVMITWWIIH